MRAKYKNDICKMTQNEYAILKLKELPLRYDNMEKIRSLVKLLQLPVVNCKAVSGYIVSRARRGRSYKSKEELNYVPSSLCETAQRASLPHKTVFYGVLSDDNSHLENARAICVSECSKLASAGKKSRGREYIANSQWLICEDIDVVCITSENSYIDVCNNKLLNAIRNDFISTFSNNSMALKIADFIEQEFSKRVANGNEEEYLLSATIADMLLYDYGFEAVVYPSVKLGGQAGMNIAIRPDVADEKLRLLNIADQCYYKNGDEGMVRIESIYDMFQDNYKPFHQISDEQLCNVIKVNDLKELNIIE